jgi:hypothetical protein
MIVPIRSTLEPDELSDVLLETYRLWIDFALGKKAIGGKMLRHPSGRYAAAITAKKDNKGRIVGIYIDDAAAGAKEARIIEHGHRAVNLKDYMLARAKVSADGHKYRRLNLRQIPTSPLQSLANIAVGGGFVSRGPKRSLRSFSSSLSKMWAANYQNAYGDNWRTMTDKPGSSPWRIPEMYAYSPARQLRDLLGPKYGRRIKIP